MLAKQLQKQQWLAFRRHPMFERNLAVRIFMYIMFGFLALEMLALGFFLDKLLQETGQYVYAIDTFNSIVLYFFMTDFSIKFFFKKNQSMVIAPYLSLPIRHNQLFDFLLRQEFTNFWNGYSLFLVVPFALKTITPIFGFGTALAYILFFYLLCIASSLIVNWMNNLIARSHWFYALPLAVVALPTAVNFVSSKINLGDYTQQLGEWILLNNLWVWLGLIVFLTALWIVNRKQMRDVVYRELQGDKVDKISSFSELSVLNRLGTIGDFMNLELKMILRSPRLKQQTVVSFPLIVGLFLYMIYSPNNTFAQSGPFIFFFYGIMAIGLMGIIMGQYIFTAESSFFDGLMSRKISAYELLKSKYLLYSGYSVLVTLILLIPVLQGKFDGFLLISTLFYAIGPVYFMIFQNAVYNKTFFDLFDKGMMNWKGQSGNMLAITMLTMFVPILLVLIARAVFGETVAYSFMLITGIAFVATSKYWLKWIYKRFQTRRYANMEGFRSNV
ncbi:hypothetical protein FACS1894176_08160 [Bacteroidia bacterium]|nr:hypothetical protein FACS1894176_08160 [Bacteroidia bacterium]